MSEVIGKLTMNYLRTNLFGILVSSNFQSLKVGLTVTFFTSMRIKININTV